MATEIQFEKALERLEKIVDDLETGDITLDDALKKYEEGVKLSRACQEKLAQAEKKIEILTKNKDGSFEKSDFAVEKASEVPSATSKKKNKSVLKPTTRKSEDDEDLLI